MTKRKLIDAEMEQTGESITNADRASIRKANASMVESRMGKVNPATGKDWFEAPSKEYQAWEDKNRRLDLEDRKATDNQTIDFNLNFLNKVRTKANDEINRSLGNQLAIQLPYNAYQNDSNRFKGAETLSSTLPGVLSALKYSNNNVSVSF